MTGEPREYVGTLTDYWILCLACGQITNECQWTYWQRTEEDGWRPSTPGEEDPMMRCPGCGWEHVDDDSNPGIMDGTRLEVARYRREVADEYLDLWKDATCSA